MNQKGFTLVELLAVFAIIAILFAISVPIVTDIISQSRNTLYNKQIDSILNSTYDYSLKNVSYLPETGFKKYITLGELKYEGMVDFDITDPKSNEKFKDNLVISIEKVGSGYKNSDIHAKVKGNYLYKVEIDKLKDSNLLPSITLKNITQNSDGNYILTLDLNQKFDNINYSAISNEGVDLTDKVKKYILSDDTPVENIDLTKSSIYKIYYTVTDDNGYANTSILNIIIADVTLPIIIFPEETIIGEEIKNFDLLDSVSCEDNSGYCDIDFSGKIDYGVVGKYIITYTAKDPSGNTSTKKRVITVR